MNVLQLTEIESEGKFRELIERAPHLVLAMDREGTVRMASPSSTRLIGPDPAELEGRAALDFVHPDDAERLRREFRMLVDGASPRFRMGFRARNPDGSWRTVAALAKLIPGPRGEPLVVATICEVAGQKAADADQASVQATLRAIVDSSPLAIIAFTPDGRVQSWNAAAEGMFGWTEAEVIRRPSPFLESDAGEENRQLLRTTLGGISVSNREMRQSGRDGATIAVSISTAPLRAPEGSVTGALWMIADITARRQDEEIIAEQARLLDFALDAILVRETDERLLYCNPEP